MRLVSGNQLNLYTVFMEDFDDFTHTPHLLSILDKIIMFVIK